MSFRLDGRVALVTGAGRGIGAAIAAGLAEQGADVACLDLDAPAETGHAVERHGRRALVLTGDVADAEAMARAVADVEAALGPLRLAVNSAGVHGTGPAAELDPQEWQRVLDVDLTGVFTCCRAEGQAMLRHGAGAIVNLASISARIANRGLEQAHYNAAKAGVVGLTRSVAVEWADRGVRVNALSPGYVRTGLARAARTSRPAEAFVDDIPMRRMAEPAEMVGPAVFLLSDAASYCTGTELVVDGGVTCW